MLLSLGVFVFFLSGCSVVHVGSEYLTDDYYPQRKSPADVVYLETVNRQHVVIAHAVVNTERRQTLDDVVGKLKKEAAIVGGDAITNIQTDSTGAWKKLPAQKLIGHAHLRVNFKADVIVFE
jgi:hypothetical protein